MKATTTNQIREQAPAPVNATGAVTPKHVPGRRLWRYFDREIRITIRLIGDNVLVSSVPPLAFAVTSALRFHLIAPRLAGVIAAAGLWSALYIYVYDATNQVKAALEDIRNKPYRPIPAGLVTVAGMRRRALAGAAVYLVLSAWIGPLPLAAAAVWAVTAFIHNLYSPPRYYLYIKPLVVVVGVLAQLVGSWTIAHPLDNVGWWWVGVITVMCYIPLPIEDVRDMDGDRDIGRRTLALVLGARPVRLWFVATMVCWPWVAYLLLFRGSGAAPAAMWATTVCFAAVCWSAALYAARNTTQHAYRVAYMFYGVMHLMLVAAALILLI